MSRVARRCRKAPVDVPPRSSRNAVPRGFTLIEVLIALTILAIVSITVFTQSNAALTQAATLEQRTLAAWVADNALAELRIEASLGERALPLGTETRYVLGGDREWRVEREIRATESERLRAVSVRVYLESDRRSDYAWASLDSFVAPGG